MDVNKTIKAIEAHIKTLQLDIEKGKALERLRSNPDFNLLLLETYINERAKEVFDLAIVPNSNASSRIEVLSRLASIAELNSFFEDVAANAKAAPQAIAVEEKYRRDMTASAARV